MEKLSAAPAPPSLEYLTDEAIQGMYRIRGMINGQISHAAPWAMWLDREGSYWLHPDYVVHDTPTGLRTVNCQYKMIRIWRDQDGYHVYLPAGIEYAPTVEPKYVDATKAEYLPVAEVVTGRR